MSEGTTTRTPLPALPPGPELAGRLAELRAADVSEAELIDVMAACERQQAGADAVQLEFMNG